MVEVEARASRLLVIILGLVEEEVGGQLLVLVAGKVGLDDKISLEAEAAQLYTR